MTKPARGCCPACGNQLPLRHVIFGGEITTFRCRDCGVRLMKNTGPAAAGVVVGAIGIYLGRRFFPENSILLFAFFALLGVMAVAAFIAADIRLATDADPDVDPEEVIPDGPPPLDPQFRGMSGPPPGNTKS